MTKKDILESINYNNFYSRHIEGFKPNGNSHEVQVCCPFHDDTSPSMSVNVTSGLYYCHACGETGHAIQFIQKKHGLSPREAKTRIMEEEGISNSAKGIKKSDKAKKTPPNYLSLDQVKLLAEQLLKDEKARGLLLEKYGLSDETAKKYLIGYQNERFVFPIEVKQGKWTFKEHKGIQLKGSEACLYPQTMLEEKSPCIIITEGELKALLLLQKGVPAISNTAGASTWKSEWSGYFAGRDVIIAYDNDEAGKKGTSKVAHHLKLVATTVKTIKWPSEMDSIEGADVGDFFIKLGKNREDFEKLIGNAVEVDIEIREVHGIRFIEPEGYGVTERAVFQTIHSLYGTQKKTLFYTPIFITEETINVQTNRIALQLSFLRDGEIKRLWVPRSEVYGRKIVDYSGYGLPVSSANVGKIHNYLEVYESVNSEMIKKTLISSGLGWKEVKGKHIFIMSGIMNEFDVKLIPDEGFEHFLKALKPKGSYKKWKAAIEKILRFPYAGFAFYASFAAPLIRILQTHNFIIDF